MPEKTTSGDVGAAVLGTGGNRAEIGTGADLPAGGGIAMGAGPLDHWKSLFGEHRISRLSSIIGIATHWPHKATSVVALGRADSPASEAVCG